MVQNNIKTQTQLLATINIQKEEGKWIWLAMFSLEHQKASINAKTWKMQNAQITLQLQKHIGWI